MTGNSTNTTNTNNTITSNNNGTDYKAFEIIHHIVSWASIIGSLMVILQYVLLQKNRNFANKLVTMLCLCDLFATVIKLPINQQNVLTNEGFCKFQAFMSQYWTMATVIWTSIIPYSLYASVVREEKNIKEKFNAYFLFTQIISLIFGLIPFITKSYGSTGLWCWIYDVNNDWNIYTAEILCLFYIPLWCSIIFNTYCFHKVYKYFVNMHDEQSEEQLERLKKLQKYPLILIFCWFMPTINRIYLISTQKPNLTLSYLHIIFQGSQGILNAFVYGLDIQLLNSLGQYKVCNLCGCIDYLKKGKDEQKKNLQLQRLSNSGTLAQNLTTSGHLFNFVDN